jgi:hypothetical protein
MSSVPSPWVQLILFYIQNKWRENEGVRLTWPSAAYFASSSVISMLTVHGTSLGRGCRSSVPEPADTFYFIRVFITSVPNLPL